MKKIANIDYGQYILDILQIAISKIQNLKMKQFNNSYSAIEELNLRSIKSIWRLK